jgi:hypothetical protein
MKKAVLVSLIVVMLSAVGLPGYCASLSSGTTLGYEKYNSEKKDPLLASALSLGTPFFPFGQIYNGENGKALGIFGGACFILAGALSNEHLAFGFFPPSIETSHSGGRDFWTIAFYGLWAYSMFDAYFSAESINNNLKIKYGVSQVELSWSVPF